MIEDLNRYFETTPREEILKEWEKICNKYDGIGPTVEEYLEDIKIFTIDKTLASGLMVNSGQYYNLLMLKDTNMDLCLEFLHKYNLENINSIPTIEIYNELLLLANL